MSLDTVLLRDEFSDDRAAGAVDGTLATDGTNTRTVNDTNNKLSITGGSLSFATGGSTTNDPAVRYPPQSRVAGLVLMANVNISSQGLTVGFDSNTTGANTDAISQNGVTLQARTNSANISVATVVANTDYRFYVLARNIGIQYAFSGGTFTYPTLLYISDIGTYAMYPNVGALGTTSVGTADSVCLAGYYLFTPLVSDGFSTNGTSDGLGHAETSGIGSGGSGVTWSNVGGGWSVSGGKAINTPTLGSELLTNGDMEGTYVGGIAPNWLKAGTATPSESADAYAGVKAQQVTNTDGASGNGIYQNVAMTAGEWISFVGYGKTVSGAGGRIGIYNPSYVNQVSSSLTTGTYQRLVATTRCIATGSPRLQMLGYGSAVVAVFDNFSANKLALTYLLSLHASSTPDIYAGIDLTVTSGTQAGLALNWDSSSSPANGIVAYHDGTNCKLEKCVAGVWTTVVSAAATYSANARIVVSKIGTAYRLYYNNALVGSGTISDAGIINNTLHGLFSTDPSNTLDNYTIYASGTGGEYDSALQIVLSNERTATMSMADSLLKVPVKMLSDILSLSDSALRTIIKSEPVQMALSSAAAKTVAKVFSDGLSLADSVLRTVITSDAVQMTLDSTTVKTIIKEFSDGIEIARSQAINYGKKIIRIIRLLGSLGVN